ncbi:MAG: L-tyrosine/L-tryptophan isonitrile synthase family protein, partial [Candidatus Ratteibacteria bacterium]|nr:L-tyrosine/L-tryptophan isonitrile synthase family protein [Candidatus Ratteibacteria bacterium]
RNTIYDIRKKLLLRITSIVVIGAFLISTVFIDFAWACPSKPWRSRTKTDSCLRPCPVRKDDRLNKKLFTSIATERLTLCKRIYDVMSSRKYRSGPKYSEDAYEELLKKLLPMVTSNFPIEILQFWGGSKNPHLPILKVDLAEEATLDNLYELSCEVRKIYSPGLKINILVTDGIIQEINNIPRERTQIYVQGLREIITRKGYDNIFSIVTVSSCYEKYGKNFRETLLRIKKKVYRDVENTLEFPTLVKHAQRNIFDVGLTPEQIEQKGIQAAKDYVVYRVAEEEARVFRDFDHCIRGFFIKRYIEKETASVHFVFYTGGKGNRVQPWQAIGRKDSAGKVQFLTQRRLKYVDLQDSRNELKRIAKYPAVTDEMLKDLAAKQNCILYAEEILDNGGIIDTEEVLRTLYNNDKLGKVFIFAQDPGKARVLDRLVKDIDSKIETITLTKEALKKELSLKRTITEVEEIKALIEFAKRNGVKPEDIFSIVKGKAKNLDSLKELSAQSGMPPILLFKASAGENNLYSLASGLELIISGGKGVIFLTPLPITQNIEEEIEEYNNSLELYSAS